jgi:hypothetical protein
MSSARGNHDDVPISGYERQRLENIAINRKRLESLNLHTSNTTRMTQKRTRVSQINLHTITTSAN